MKKKWIVGGAWVLALACAAFLLIANFWMIHVEFDGTMITEKEQRPVHLSLSYNCGAEWFIPGTLRSISGLRAEMAARSGEEQVLYFTTEGDNSLQFTDAFLIIPFGAYGPWLEEKPGTLGMSYFNRKEKNFIFTADEFAILSADEDFQRLVGEHSKSWQEWADRIV